MHAYYTRDEIWSKKLRFYEYEIFLLKIDFAPQFGIFRSKVGSETFECGSGEGSETVECGSKNVIWPKVVKKAQF